MTNDRTLKFPEAARMISKELPIAIGTLRKKLTRDPNDHDPMKLHSVRLGGKGSHNYINLSEVNRFIKAFKG